MTTGVYELNTIQLQFSTIQYSTVHCPRLAAVQLLSKSVARIDVDLRLSSLH